MTMHQASISNMKKVSGCAWQLHRASVYGLYVCINITNASHLKQRCIAMQIPTMRPAAFTWGKILDLLILGMTCSIHHLLDVADMRYCSVSIKTLPPSKPYCWRAPGRTLTEIHVWDTWIQSSHTHEQLQYTYSLAKATLSHQACCDPIRAQIFAAEIHKTFILSSSCDAHDHNLGLNHMITTWDWIAMPPCIHRDTPCHWLACHASQFAMLLQFSKYHNNFQFNTFLKLMQVASNLSSAHLGFSNLYSWQRDTPIPWAWTATEMARRGHQRLKRIIQS